MRSLWVLSSFTFIGHNVHVHLGHHSSLHVPISQDGEVQLDYFRECYLSNLRDTREKGPCYMYDERVKKWSIVKESQQRKAHACKYRVSSTSYTRAENWSGCQTSNNQAGWTSQREARVWSWLAWLEERFSNVNKYMVKPKQERSVQARFKY